MDIFTLQNPHLRMRVASQGAALLALETADNQPILRRWPAIMPFHPGDSALFPMLPLANRVAGNRFPQGQNSIELPGKPGDPEGFLHGDGWLLDWTAQQTTSEAITLQLRATQPCGFDYHAVITYRLKSRRFLARLVITHCGTEPMLYGAGFHPFFAKTPNTQLHFNASGYWPEGERHLPLDWTPALPDALNFSAPQTPGAQWINNGFSGWSGIARLTRPEREVIIRSNTPWLMVYQTEVSAFICLEPQTHPVNAHNMPAQPGLRMLAEGESVAIEMEIAVSESQA